MSECSGFPPSAWRRDSAATLSTRPLNFDLCVRMGRAASGLMTRHQYANSVAPSPHQTTALTITDQYLWKQPYSTTRR
ncbi:hypothetical protein J6590_034957 [Homalodisca vitripennis]|nr:hypothetical protein J6590_034957 [Homalodisca vitripennis]